MCSSPKVPKATPPQEPMKDAAARSAEASDEAAREQARRRGYASAFTRFNSDGASGETPEATIGG